jgi:hypothetical protein
LKAKNIPIGDEEMGVTLAAKEEKYTVPPCVSSPTERFSIVSNRYSA